MADPSAHQPLLENPNQEDIFDPEAEAAAMAAAMGFSSFGQQAPAPDSETEDNDPGPPFKKRRYNSRVDAYVGPIPQGTGANDVPVQRRASNAPRDENEINLEDNEINLHNDDEGVATGGDDAMTTTLPTKNPFLPPKPHFTLPANPSLPPKPQPQHFHAASNEKGFNSQIKTKSDEHNDARGGRGGRGGGRGGGHGGNNHDRDPTKLWYIDYYDPSSNENPWESLEQRRGMEAVGLWLPSRSGGGGRGGFKASGSHDAQQGAQHEGQPSVQQEA